MKPDLQIVTIFIMIYQGTRNKFGSRTLIYLMPRFWNFLPDEIFMLNSKSKFKKLVKEWVIQKCKMCL